MRPIDVPVEKVATGFAFTEGPVWLPDNSLIFSDIPNNNIRRWTPDGAVTIWRARSGCDDPDESSPNRGSNGMTLDREGCVLICEHGNRRVSRLERDGGLTPLAVRYDGKRLNSPNDIVVKSDGGIYFTDPPYGLDDREDHPEKELPFSGVYRLRDGTVELLTDQLPRPNGLAFSPDEKFLYVGNSQRERMIWMRYPVREDGTLGPGDVFYDAAGHNQPGVPDGFRVGKDGKLYCTGPGGILVLSPDGEYLGTVQIPEVTANCVFGDPDRKALYVCATTSIYRIRGLL